MTVTTLFLQCGVLAYATLIVNASKSYEGFRRTRVADSVDPEGFSRSTLPSGHYTSAVQSETNLQGVFRAAWARILHDGRTGTSGKRPPGRGRTTKQWWESRTIWHLLKIQQLWLWASHSHSVIFVTPVKSKQEGHPGPGTGGPWTVLISVRMQTWLSMFS